MTLHLRSIGLNVQHMVYFAVRTGCDAADALSDHLMDCFFFETPYRLELDSLPSLPSSYTATGGGPGPRAVSRLHDVAVSFFRRSSDEPSFCKGGLR